MTQDAAAALELEDIQSGVLRPRPTPYAATYIALRIDAAKTGRQLMRRLSESVASAAHPSSPTGDTWLSAMLTFEWPRGAGRAAAFARQFRVEFGRAWCARADAR